MFYHMTRINHEFGPDIVPTCPNSVPTLFRFGYDITVVQRYLYTS